MTLKELAERRCAELYVIATTATDANARIHANNELQEWQDALAASEEST